MGRIRTLVSAKTWDCSYRLRQDRVGSISVCLSRGTGPTVFFIHGNSSCKEVFGYQFEALRRADFSVLAFDLPGHGQSGDAVCPEQTYSFPGYARVAHMLLDKLHFFHVCVVGWSLGGHIGLELLGSCPKVEALLITGTPPVKPGPKALADAFLPSPTMELAGKREYSEDDVLRYATAMLGEAKNPYLLQTVRRTHGDARSWMARNGLAGIGIDGRELVEAESRPLAVIHGANDPFIDLSYLKTIRYRNLWRHEVQVMEDAGHAPFLARPDAFNALLLEFLAEVFASEGVRAAPV